MSLKTILLVEDDSQDELLTLRSLRKAKVANRIDVVRTALLPVVILTLSDDERDRMKSYQFGANSFVRKPVDFAEFAATVAQLGIYWLATNEPPPGL